MVAVTDADLRRLPPPAWTPSVARGQRPAVVGLAVCLSVTAGLLWVCALSVGWLVAVAGTQAASPFGEEGYVFHTLDSFVLRMGDGLWLPLYGFPLASVVSGFLLLDRQAWTRLAHTVVGVAAAAWSGWWLRESLLVWVVVTVYIAVAVGVLWVPSASRWYTRSSRRPG